MAKRVDKSRFELEELGFRARREDEFIERLVLPTDTLQGIALLYNTTIGDLKKINHILSETELHARRVIRVPSKGILVDLTEDVAKPKPPEAGSSSISVVDFVSGEFTEGDEDQDNNTQVYLKNVDTVVKEIKEKAEIAAANSPILNGSDSPLLSRKEFAKKKGDIKWWLILIPCLAVLIGFPVLYFIYREQVLERETDHHIDHKHNTSSSSISIDSS